MKTSKNRLMELANVQSKRALNEAVNPELDAVVKKFVKGLAAKYQYGDIDALYAIFDSLKRQQMLGRDVNYRPY